ncbi:MAG: VanZ family protein [Methylococcaceae bacterium]|nr:VanZ family protein [Methylococcaceae bacterium]
MTKYFDLSALLLYCLFIYWLSDQQSLPSPTWWGLEFQDKINHAGAYFIMATFAWRSFRHIGTSSIVLALISILFCSLYGASDEWHQSFVEGRSSDVMDWLADTSGAVMAMVCLYFFQRRNIFVPGI